MNSSRQRKIAYLLAIVVLFTGIIGVGQWIQWSADKNGLAQKSLGKVNPISGTAQLVFMGMRGVAVTFLWHEAIELKKHERWFEIRPVLESITLLQPNFVNPWTFQAWNMAYNICAEWESVPDKYHWIREGIDFMKNAVETNKDKTDMEWYVGWLYHNRFGMSDEKTFLRDMFRNETDDNFALAQSGIKDNFQVAYDWFGQANDTIRRLQEPPKSKGIMPFMTYPALAKSYYADLMQQEGTFGEKTKNAWRAGHNEWLEFGREGGPDKDEDLKLRLEYSPEEWNKLTDTQRYWVDRYRGVVNYNSWKKRTATESTDEMQEAREAFYNAEKDRKEGNYKKAIAEYEKAFPLWRQVMERDANMREDLTTIEDSQKYERNYLRLLRLLDQKLPATRPFEGLFKPAEETPIAPATDLKRDEPKPIEPKPAAERAEAKSKDAAKKE
ncbi:hypothetical protein Pan216_50440 [Planctomycetes bacterium Pan216]|uniref:IRE (Iron responsive element) n=1 Tax=Kolteria novifilia TaxID=2527975 RepID=A0A518BAZ6_9BACT|nr:hypothetical protein Pan216_50440 [Planctomycetes bacterium Pan216]